VIREPGDRPREFPAAIGPQALGDGLGNFSFWPLYLRGLGGEELLGLGNKSWYFYIASLLIHGLLAYGISLLPQGFFYSLHEAKKGALGIYQVRLLEGREEGLTVRSHEKRLTKGVKAASRTTSPVKRKRAVVKPRVKEIATVSKASKKIRVVKNQSRKACRGPVREFRPSKGEREKVASSPLASFTGRDIEWILNGPEYGEEDPITSVSSFLGGKKAGAFGGGEEGRHRGVGLIPPVPLVREKPPYPPLARRRGYEGKLVVRFLVTPRGLVDKVTLVKSSGYSILDRAAVKTVKRWRFSPAMNGGRPIPYWVEVPVVFDLRERKGS